MKLFIWDTPNDTIKKIALRIRDVRKRRKISQIDLEKMSGVSLGSIKRFETTGNISLISLTKIAYALDIKEDLDQLFNEVPYRDIQDRKSTRLNSSHVF